MLHIRILLVLHAGVRARRLRLVVRGRGLVALGLWLIFVSTLTWRLMRVTARLQTISLILSLLERIRRGAGVHHAVG